MKKAFAIFAILAGFSLVPAIMAQPYITDLYGFRLNQSRQAPINEFGEPSKSGRYDDGREYDAFLLKSDPPLYMVFEYPIAQMGMISSIQITGSDRTTDLAFRGLRMGMAPSEVERELGKPSKKADVGEHGTRWEYHKTNFSIEISPDGKLASVRIGTIPDKVHPAPDGKKLPGFEVVMKVLTAGTNDELARLISPDAEIYRDGKVLYFSRPIRDEIASDKSKVFAAVRQLAQELRTIDSRSTAEFEENSDFAPGDSPRHVMKFKKGGKVKEIVFKYLWGEFLIWEIDAGKPVKDELAVYAPRTLKELTTTIPESLFKDPNIVLYDSQKKADIRLSYNSYTSRVKVVYAGEARKVAERKKFVIDIWLQTLGKPKELLQLFEMEYLFREDNKEYWLPVQKAAAAKLSTEVKKGDVAMLFVAWLGGRHEPSGFDNVFLVNDLKKE